MNDRSLGWDDDGYGSPQHITVIHAHNGPELRNQIRDRRWRYDCGIEGMPGQCYASSCEILHVGKVETGLAAVLKVTRHFDI
jgi:hypothetical protein